MFTGSELLVLGGFLVFVGGVWKRQTEGKNISHPTLLGTERLSLRAYP